MDVISSEVYFTLARVDGLPVWNSAELKNGFLDPSQLPLAAVIWPGAGSNQFLRGWISVNLVTRNNNAYPVEITVDLTKNVDHVDFLFTWIPIDVNFVSGMDSTSTLEVGDIDGDGKNDVLLEDGIYCRNEAFDGTYQFKFEILGTHRLTGITSVLSEITDLSVNIDKGAPAPVITNYHGEPLEIRGAYQFNVRVPQTHVNRVIMEYSVDGNSWTPLATVTSPVGDMYIYNWATDGIPEGSYLFRATAVEDIIAGTLHTGRIGNHTIPVIIDRTAPVISAVITPASQYASPWVSHAAHLAFTIAESNTISKFLIGFYLYSDMTLSLLNISYVDFKVSGVLDISLLEKVFSKIPGGYMFCSIYDEAGNSQTSYVFGGSLVQTIPIFLDPILSLNPIGSWSSSGIKYGDNISIIVSDSFGIPVPGIDVDVMLDGYYFGKARTNSVGIASCIARSLDLFSKNFGDQLHVSSRSATASRIDYGDFLFLNPWDGSQYEQDLVLIRRPFASGEHVSLSISPGSIQASQFDGLRLILAIPDVYSQDLAACTLESLKITLIDLDGNEFSILLDAPDLGEFFEADSPAKSSVIIAGGERIRMISAGFLLGEFINEATRSGFDATEIAAILVDGENAAVYPSYFDPYQPPMQSIGVLDARFVKQMVNTPTTHTAHLEMSTEVSDDFEDGLSKWSIHEGAYGGETSISNEFSFPENAPLEHSVKIQGGNYPGGSLIADSTISYLITDQRLMHATYFSIAMLCPAISPYGADTEVHAWSRLTDISGFIVSFEFKGRDIIINEQVVGTFTPAAWYLFEASIDWLSQTITAKINGTQVPGSFPFSSSAEHIGILSIMSTWNPSWEDQYNNKIFYVDNFRLRYEATTYHAFTIQQITTKLETSLVSQSIQRFEYSDHTTPDQFLPAWTTSGPGATDFEVVDQMLYLWNGPGSSADIVFPDVPVADGFLDLSFFVAMTPDSYKGSVGRYAIMLFGANGFLIETKNFFIERDIASGQVFWYWYPNTKYPARDGNGDYIPYHFTRPLSNFDHVEIKAAGTYSGAKCAWIIEQSTISAYALTAGTYGDAVHVEDILLTDDSGFTIDASALSCLPSESLIMDAYVGDAYHATHLPSTQGFTSTKDFVNFGNPASTYSNLRIHYLGNAFFADSSRIIRNTYSVSKKATSISFTMSNFGETGAFTDTFDARVYPWAVELSDPLSSSLILDDTMHVQFEAEAYERSAEARRAFTLGPPSEMSFDVACHLGYIYIYLQKGSGKVAQLEISDVIDPAISGNTKLRIRAQGRDLYAISRKIQSWFTLTVSFDWDSLKYGIMIDDSLINGTIDATATNLALSGFKFDTITMTCTPLPDQESSMQLDNFHASCPSITAPLRQFEVDYGASARFGGMISQSSGGILFPVIPRNYIMINEVGVDTIGPLNDSVELYNVGPSRDMTGWNITWYWQDVGGGVLDGSYEYAFPAGCAIPAYSVFTILSSAGTDAVDRLYMNHTIPWTLTSTIAVGLTKPSGANADWFQANGFTGDSPNGASWDDAGSSLLFSNLAPVLARGNLTDSNTTSDWICRPGRTTWTPNAGQYAFPVCTLWRLNSPSGMWASMKVKYDPELSIILQLYNKNYPGIPAGMGFYNWQIVEFNQIGSFSHEVTISPESDSYLRPGYYAARYTFLGNERYLGSTIEFRLNVGKAPTKLEYMNPSGPDRNPDDFSTRIENRAYQNGVFRDQEGEPFEYIELQRCYGDNTEFTFKLTGELGQPLPGKIIILQIGLVPSSFAMSMDYFADALPDYLALQREGISILNIHNHPYEQLKYAKPIYYPFYDLVFDTYRFWGPYVFVHAQTNNEGIASFNFTKNGNNMLPVERLIEDAFTILKVPAEDLSNIQLYVRAFYSNYLDMNAMRLDLAGVELSKDACVYSVNDPSPGLIADAFYESSYSEGKLHVVPEDITVLGGHSEILPNDGYFDIAAMVVEANKDASGGLVPESLDGLDVDATGWYDDVKEYPVSATLEIWNEAGDALIAPSTYLISSTDEYGVVSFRISPATVTT
nr:lamin tail domain-containing protein [Candidatus Sigynarchaeota archaeon]